MLEFRNTVTLLIVGVLIGGSGGAIVYDSTFRPLDVESRTVLPDGSTETEFAKRIPLSESQLFNIWLGSILGYGGAVVGTLYKASKANGED